MCVIILMFTKVSVINKQQLVWLSGQAEIQIRVTDMNDNAPFFSERVYTARVPENTDIGTIVMTVTADDLDEGESDMLWCLWTVW